jgi:hypothetical protein
MLWTIKTIMKIGIDLCADVLYCELGIMAREGMESEMHALIWPGGLDVVDNQDMYENWY